MRARKITLEEFFEITLERFKERVESGEINNQKIKQISELLAESSQLKDCDIFVDDGCILFKERK